MEMEKLYERYNKLKSTLSPEVNQLFVDVFQELSEQSFVIKRKQEQIDILAARSTMFVENSEQLLRNKWIFHSKAVSD